MVLAGFIVLGISTYLCVMSLEKEAVEEASAEQGRRAESHVTAMVERFAEAEMARGGDLASFSARLLAAAEGNPAVLDLVIVDGNRHEVGRFSRRDVGEIPCVGAVPLDRPVEREHPPGTVGRHAVACKTVPVTSGDEQRGLVLFHAVRDWGEGSTHVAGIVQRTAFRMAPIFALFYVLLAALLIAASRAARQWRARAASYERVQTLGALADGINHEIKNPLNTIGLSLQLLAKKHAEPETKEVVDTATREAERIRDRIEEFVRFTRVSRLHTDQVDLGERLRERFGETPGLEIRGDARAGVDVAKFDEATGALLEFLGHQCDETEGVLVTLTQSRDEWRIVAQGCACDVDAADVDRFFDPYLRRRGHDVGRGLALARAVFQAHGGDLVAQVKGWKLRLRGHAPRVPPGQDGVR